MADPIQVTEVLIKAPVYGFDRARLVASRERRRIVGDFVLDWLDVVSSRQFADTIALTKSDYDSHGYQIHPYFMLKPGRPPGNRRHQFTSYVPYRCLLPRHLEGILVVGLGLSAHRDAMPILRMQPDLQNIGYAAGIAAAMAARGGKGLREIDVRELQKRIIAAGGLTSEIPRHRDAATPSPEVLRDAVARLVKGFDGLEVVMAWPKQSLPELHRAYDEAASAENRLVLALVLGIMRDPHGAESLIREAERLVTDDDLEVARDAYGLDPVVRVLWALGRSPHPDVLPALIRLADSTVLTSSTRFRAAAVCLGERGDTRAVPLLRKLVARKEGSNSVLELIAASALFRCGDPDGTARRILERMAVSANAPFADLATQLLGGA